MKRLYFFFIDKKTYLKRKQRKESKIVFGIFGFQSALRIIDVKSLPLLLAIGCYARIFAQNYRSALLLEKERKAREKKKACWIY